MADDDDADTDDGDSTGEPTAKGTMSTTKFSVQDRDLSSMGVLNEERQEAYADQDDES